MSERRIIALITDFGYRDPYVGVMKGVIKGINPDAEVIDITHGIRRHDVLEAAITLLVSAPYFPKGTIFVVVVDPGVGSERRALLVKTRNYILVGPDNGCLSALAERDGIEEAYDISDSPYRLREVSHTFHGRDIFAPIAAWVSKLGVPGDIGRPIDPSSMKKIDIGRPSYDPEEGGLWAEVIYIDVYGNAMTNAGEREVGLLGLGIGDEVLLRVSGREFRCTYTTTFSRVPVGELACYINSWGYLEVAVNMGDAASLLNVKPGDRLLIKRAA